MSESISQGIPFLNLDEVGLKLYKCNDISFTNLQRYGFNCQRSLKKPDQLVTHEKNILIGIEDKSTSRELDIAIKQIKDNYLDVLPDTKYFIARAGERVKVFYRIAPNQIIEIGTTLKGKEVVCFGPRVITGENEEVQINLSKLAKQIFAEKTPVNSSLEIEPPKEYYNPLTVKQSTIYNLWQKIFVSTGENAHICLATFVELLLYKGISDAKLLPRDYSIESLVDPSKTNSLDVYKNVIRNYIRTRVFPTIGNQPGVINSFAFEEQETVFKTVLSDLQDLGNLANRQIDPDFKRRVIEAFLGSAHSEGTIKSGKHLTPRIIIQAIWEMAEPVEGKKIVDPACGVGGFVLEGLNYPYEFNPVNYNCFGIDRDEQMIITAKANMVLHLLDKFVDPSINNSDLVSKINSTFYQARNNGTGTLGELNEIPAIGSEFTAKYNADYVFANIPFYINGVTQIDQSLNDIGLSSFFKSCGLGVESRFIKYILSQIKNGDPGIAYVIVTDGILYRHKDRIREVIKENSNVLGLISLPVGCFQNNNWKTSIIIFKKKEVEPEYSPVFLYNVENIGISLDSYRTPIEENDIPSMKKAWRQRHSGIIEDPNCKLIPRSDFNNSRRWSDLFDWCRSMVNGNAISFSEFIEASDTVNKDITEILADADRTLGDVFALENFIEIELGNKDYFKTGTASFKTTVKHARLHPGKYPLFSSQVDGPVEFMGDSEHLPLLIKNETEAQDEKLISWNIKGDPCKDIREHNEPFYVTENRGLISIIDNNIDLYYLLYYLKEHLVKLGNFKRSDEAHAGKVKSIKIKFPVKDNGELDLVKQQDVARNYEKILGLRKNINAKIIELKELLNNIDVFK